MIDRTLGDYPAIQKFIALLTISHCIQIGFFLLGW
jgi:hypothetical protein